MYKVIRRDPYGHNGFKYFETKDQAEKFVMSAKARQDIADGFSFSIVLESEIENRN